MNGMPHGGDGIPNNDFSGHFCVHFFRSTTHRSTDPDLAHQLMVHKAAGNLRSFFDSASPLIIAESFIVAMNQQDSEMLRQVSEGIEKEKLESFMQEMESLMSIQTEKQRGTGKTNNLNDSSWDESLSAEVKLQIVMHKKGDSKRKIAYVFIFKRASKHLPWRLENVLTPQLPFRDRAVFLTPNGIFPIVPDLRHLSNLSFVHFNAKSGQRQIIYKAILVGKYRGID
jgi:hypothetical protein